MPIRNSDSKAQFYNIGHSLSSLSQVNFNATPSFTTTVANVNFPATGGSFPQWPGGPSDFFAVRLTGSIFIPTTGTYSFSTTSDDGSVLYLDGLQILNNDGLHADATRVSVQRTNLLTGAHSFRNYECSKTAARRRCLPTGPDRASPIS